MIPQSVKNSRISCNFRQNIFVILTGEFVVSYTQFEISYWLIIIILLEFWKSEIMSKRSFYRKTYGAYNWLFCTVSWIFSWLSLRSCIFDRPVDNHEFICSSTYLVTVWSVNAWADGNPLCGGYPDYPSLTDHTVCIRQAILLYYFE